MSSTDTLAAFFGWCTVINIGIYLLTVAALAAFRKPALRINAKIFAITEEQVALASFQYIGHYKLAITILCFVPYVALKILSS
jgi:hypothetical protein